MLSMHLRSSSPSTNWFTSTWSVDNSPRPPTILAEVSKEYFGTPAFWLRLLDVLSESQNEKLLARSDSDDRCHNSNKKPRKAEWLLPKKLPNPIGEDGWWLYLRYWLTCLVWTPWFCRFPWNMIGRLSTKNLDLIYLTCSYLLLPNLA